MALLLLGACEDLGPPTNQILNTDDLLVLQLSGAAPQPSSASFWIYNGQGTVHRLNHADQFNTPFLELEFPANSIRSIGGRDATQGDSALVTVDPNQGSYGFTLSPASLRFNTSASPIVTFFFGVYGDASVATASATYVDEAAYVAALDVWQEVTVEQWSIVAASGATGPDVVSGTVSEPGRYLLAAPR